MERTVRGVPGQRAVEWLRTLGESLKEADVPEEKADLGHAIYGRIVVAGPEIVRVRLTSAAYATDWRWRGRKGCSGAPDRCGTRDFNLHHPDRGPR
jgi:Asp-tRNA(Asn)/Glu-tRNA(Gln) amidotransferase A subunit family amidase